MPSIEELVRRFPHLEAEIRDHLPLILLLESSRFGSISLADQECQYHGHTQVNGIEIKDVIGKGAFGVVYRAYQPELDRFVAIKTIDLETTESAEAKRIDLERKVMARLSHPNIVPVYSCHQEGRYAYLVMKLIEGCDLKRIISKECSEATRQTHVKLTSNWKHFAQVVADLASGLAHAHESGVIHRDIKPGNLILEESGKIWLADFGLVKISDQQSSLTATGNTVGTLRYMAPEQLRGHCDERSDIYSLGLSLFEFLTEGNLLGLQVSNTSQNFAEILIQRLGMPTHLAQAIEKMCAFDPSDRFQSARKLSNFFASCANGLCPNLSHRGKTYPATSTSYPKWSRFYATACTVFFGFVLHLPSSVPPRHPSRILHRTIRTTSIAWRSCTKIPTPASQTSWKRSATNPRRFYLRISASPKTSQRRSRINGKA